MDTTKIRFKKLDEKAQMPYYGSEYAAGADLYACMEEPLTIAAGTTEFVHTGLAMEIPVGLVGLVYARSGLACKKGLAPANKVGVIDSDYRGEIMVALHNHSAEDITIEAGERVAQMVIAPYVFAQYEEAEELEDTVRGDGGFGHSGTK
ncbi:MAG: dUTP diphosphatase [Eubacterium sp.]|nr:dUTP diphosphatase [Eubacterium sp.]